MVPLLVGIARLLAQRGESYPVFCIVCFQPSISQSYGKNWSFLWDSTLKDWQVLILVAAFFIGVWAALLTFLTWLSKIHTWFLAIFAVGIGAPRWCQVNYF